MSLYHLDASEEDPPKSGAVAFACLSLLDWLHALLGCGPLDVAFSSDASRCCTCY
jgi:hypothetical protein